MEENYELTVMTRFPVFEPKIDIWRVVQKRFHRQTGRQKKRHHLPSSAGKWMQAWDYRNFNPFFIYFFTLLFRFWICRLFLELWKFYKKKQYSTFLLKIIVKFQELANKSSKFKTRKKRGVKKQKLYKNQETRCWHP